MLAKTYAAFTAADAPEEEAQAAGLAAIEDRLTTFSADVNVRFTMLTWAIVINATATMPFSAFC